VQNVNNTLTWEGQAFYEPVSRVGGYVVPIDKLALLALLLASYAQLIGLTSTAIIAVTVATTVYVKRRKKKQ
jgi:hypothetical protein